MNAVARPIVKKLSHGLRLLLFVIIVPMTMGIGGCPNVLSTFSQKDSDEALLFEAQIDANSKLWDDGITAINKMTPGGLAQRGTQVFLASLYAGRCGVDLLSVADALSNIGTKKFLPFLLLQFKGGTALGAADCKMAEQIMLGITTTFTDFSSDEAVFLAMVEMGKIGSTMAQSGMDADDDGVLDPAFPIDAASNASYCPSTSTPSATVIVDENVQEIGTGLMIMANALEASGAKVGSAVTDVFDPLCTTLAAAPYNLTGFCQKTATSDFDATDTKMLRTMIRANELGFDQCGGASTSAGCVCP